MDVLQEKKALRRLARARRDAMPPDERAAAERALCALLSELPELRSAKTVLGYAAVGSEAALGALYAAVRSRGAVLAFPVTDAEGRMEAYVPAGPLAPGRFAIPEPDPARSRLVPSGALDAVLVPCLGFDAALRRLGQGGGFYDRYLLRCPQAALVLTAFESQRLSAVPVEPHDLAFSLLVTEAGVFRK